MIKILKYLLTEIFWRFLFDNIIKLDFVTLTNNFRVQLLTMSSREILSLYWDLLSNRISNHNLFISLQGANVNSLTDTNPKRFFWLGMTFTLIVYKWFILFKRLILWPFKLGIFTFIFSTLGIDVSWLFGWFNIFPFTIPQWVYIQYLSLYNNWLGWWNNTGQIKNLTSLSLPNSEVSNLENNILPIDNDNTPSNKDSKIFNRTNLYILLGVVTLVGLGVLYYYYSDFGGSSSGSSSSSSTSSSATPSRPPIAINNNKTPDPVAIPVPVPDPVPVRTNKELAKYFYENAVEWGREGKASMIERLDILKQDSSRAIPTLKDYSDPWNVDNNASGSTQSYTTRVIQEPSSSSTKPTYADVARPSSPTGSDGSGDTIVGYNSPEGKPIFGFRNNK